MPVTSAPVSGGRHRRLLASNRAASICARLEPLRRIAPPRRVSPSLREPLAKMPMSLRITQSPYSVLWSSGPQLSDRERPQVHALGGQGDSNFDKQALLHARKQYFVDRSCQHSFKKGYWNLYTVSVKWTLGVSRLSGACCAARELGPV